MDLEKPTIIGGKPIFKDSIPIIQPTLPEFKEISNDVAKILESGMITNHTNVRKFENLVKNYLKVKNVISVSNCTTGLMLIGRCLNLQGDVITPSFSFSATSLSLIWLGLKPIFVDCLPEKFTIDPKKVVKKITSNTSAILATHIFGNPCNVEELQEIAEDYNLKLVFDSAHGAGSIYKGIKIGNFGNAESFSMSPTKVLTAGEGGFVATNDSRIKNCIELGRNYGNPGDYDTSLIGLSGRMAEFNAILAIRSLEMLERNVQNRQKIVSRYKTNLKKIPGISFQKIEEKCRSSYKDFAIIVDKSEFGISRDKLYEALKAENIMTKKYFFPPIHQQKVFKKYSKNQNLDLAITEKLSKKILCLPIYSHMHESKIERICRAIERIFNFSQKIDRFLENKK